MGNQPVNQVAEPQVNADAAAQQGAGSPSDMGAAPAGSEQSPQDFEAMYRQAMEDNSVLTQNLTQAQQFAQQVAQQMQAQQAQQSLQQYNDQQSAFLASIRDLPDEERERRTKEFYGNQTAQVMQMAQGFVQQTAAERWRDQLAAQYGLDEEDRRILAGAHPSQMEQVAYSLQQRNQKFQQIQNQIQQVTASQVAQQMQNSGAYAGGGGNQSPNGGGANSGQQIEPGSRSHLHALLRGPQ